ncbi:hypothetical protein SM764_04105 [Pseudophaeobacter sp. 1A16562]|uniref:hypothetical protein n=1 Tax=Pseudophaeobacter sp. 1A16562 TaxID=3098143 RepID=UPI0034D49BB0
MTSIDKYLGYYFFENPPLFGAASWQPDISDIPYDAHGRYEIDITALSVEVSIYNDGFSPTLIIGYKCSSNQQYSASDIMFYDGSTSAQVIGPFTAKSTLTFEQDKDILLANGSSETISFRPSNLYVEIEGVPDFSPLEGKDFLLSGGTFASCHVLHWYQDRLWGLPQVLHYSSDTLNPPGVALFSAIISNGVTEEIKRRVGAP